MKTANETIATKIMNQLGGFNRVDAMVGLKDCMVNGAGLSFKIKLRGAAANYVKIQLNGLDLYDLEIGKLRGGNYNVIKSMDNVYADMLKGIVETTCKVRLSL